MHFDIQHNTLQIKHKKNYFFFLFYNNQNTWKMNQKIFLLLHTDECIFCYIWNIP